MADPALIEVLRQIRTSLEVLNGTIIIAALLTAVAIFAVRPTK